MARWLRTVALASALLMVAGCASPAGEDGAAAVEASEGLGVDAAPGSHTHDDWQGRDWLVVVDGRSPVGGFSYTGSSGAAFEFRPPEGNTVPQGAGRIEATLDWVESNDASLPQDYEWMELWAKTAQDTEPRPVGRAEKGQAFTFESTNEQDDPPHYVLSLWRFLVVVHDGDAGTSFTGQFLLKVEAFRTLPLVLAPPHPDRWGGAAELVLAEVEQAVTLQARGEAAQTCLAGGCLGPFAPADGQVVPQETGEVVVTLTPSQDSVPLPIGVRYHGADTYAMTPVEPESALPGARVFRIALADSRPDSPYALQSLWEFATFLDSPEEQGAWHGTLHIQVKAVRGA